MHNTHLHKLIDAFADLFAAISCAQCVGVCVCVLHLSKLTRCFNLQCMWVVKPNLHPVPIQCTCNIWPPSYRLMPHWSIAETRWKKKVIIQLDIPNDFQFYPDDHDAEKNYTRQDIYESLIWLALARSASPWCCVSHGRTNIARVFLSATWFSLYVACPFEKHSPINRERERRER